MSLKISGSNLYSSGFDAQPAKYGPQQSPAVSQNPSDKMLDDAMRAVFGDNYEQTLADAKLKSQGIGLPAATADAPVEQPKKKKKKKGFFKKLGGFLKKAGGFLKKALPIISTVASFIPGLNAIAIPLKIATAVMSGIDAVKSKNWLGAIGSFAGAFAGGAAAFGATKIANVANTISQGASKLEGFFGAVKSGSPSGILGAAAGTLEWGSGKVADVSADWATRLSNWADTARTWGRYAGYLEHPQTLLGAGSR